MLETHPLRCNPVIFNARWVNLEHACLGQNSKPINNLFPGYAAIIDTCPLPPLLQRFLLELKSFYRLSCKVILV